MILADSSVWVEFFRRRPCLIHDEMNVLLEKTPIDIATCGVVVQEVLQGVKRQADFEWVKSRLLMIPWLDATHAIYLHAAQISRDLREVGIVITAIDALIASTAVGSDAELWTLDKDFEYMVSKGLRLYRKK